MLVVFSVLAALCCRNIVANAWLLKHAFIIQFANPEDRDYYAFKDPAHRAVVEELGPLLEKVQNVNLPRSG
ncbi:hypothetical protein EDB81DRAFT_814243 [Dactylonectria macrodidyma]|uniref:Stress-response A/B barrel domain-containing protein n=1 Tax=Dactylonectria macrodidyma TaxID=307937 RepID=A0A9P9DJB1_9HYPO|nr:hypothetical protein EDB81DRAFT_814243 [Dactylonectria macrodidyma]